jgi:hypothetical protein
LPLVGSDEVTFGPAIMQAPGTTAPAGVPSGTPAPPPPKIGSFPPHPTITALSKKTINQFNGLLKMLCSMDGFGFESEVILAACLLVIASRAIASRMFSGLFICFSLF